MTISEGLLNDKIEIKKAHKLNGVIELPGDKSISHRAAILALLSSDKTEIVNYATGEDCKRTLDICRALGAEVAVENNIVTIVPPAERFKTPEDPLDCGNSGTTMRLMAGFLAGAGIKARLIGDQSLSLRPMQRLVDPLREMNAVVIPEENGTAPLDIVPDKLISLDYTLPVASAQVKSALLLAGLASQTPVTVREKVITRDHTERLINFMGGQIEINDIKSELIADPDDPRKKKRVLPTEDYKRMIRLPRQEKLAGGRIEIPGDFSTAAFFIAAGLLVKGSHVIIKNIGFNPTRNAFVAVLRQMGAVITVKNKREWSGEPVVDLEVLYSQLKPRKIHGDSIAALIDELPLLALLAGRIEGTTVIRDAEELRHKESDRIKAMAQNLGVLGIKTGEFPDGLAIEGRPEWEGGVIDSFGDHRIAMTFAVAGLAAHGRTYIKGGRVAAVSCPAFYEMLEGLRR